jgi:hypothetical protein
MCSDMIPKVTCLQDGEESYEQFMEEKEAILSSLARRAQVKFCSKQRLPRRYLAFLLVCCCCVKHLVVVYILLNIIRF